MALEKRGEEGRGKVEAGTVTENCLTEECRSKKTDLFHLRLLSNYRNWLFNQRKTWLFCAERKTDI